MERDDRAGQLHAQGGLGVAFALGALLNSALVVTEFVFGYLSGSLALVSDAVHNLSDVLGLLLAWGAAWLAGRRESASRTYGFRRAPILAALANGVLLFVATGAVLVEAAQRFAKAPPVASRTVIFVALAATAINAATALLFARGRKRDLNVRGAFVHMASDAAVSLGVAIAGVVIWRTGWLWLDPVASVAIAMVILWTAWSFTHEALDLALDAVPAGVDPAAVTAFLAQLPQVSEVYDLHIWAMSTTETALTVHLVRPGAGLDDAFLTDVALELATRFDIGHATIQVETGADEAARAPRSSV
jgi:cobalt-zinc-cadmium efflux system protein